MDKENTSFDFRKFYIDAFKIHNESVLQTLIASSHYKKIEKNTPVICQGEIETTVPLIVSGLFLGYNSDENGNEHIDCFPSDFGEPVIGAPSFGQPSPVSLIAAVDSEIVSLPVSTIRYLLTNSLDIIRVYAHIALISSEKHRKYHQILCEKDTFKRYKLFRKYYGQAADQLSQKTVASIINVSEVWLSRMIKKYGIRE